MPRVLLAFVLILEWVCVAPANAQQDSCQQRTIPVSISTRDAAPVPPLTAVDFEAVYEKKSVRVVSVAVNREPTRVVLLFDASGSMHEQRARSEWNFALDIAEDLLTVQPRTSEIGLELFAATSVRIADPTIERIELKNKLEALRARSKTIAPSPQKTALWDAILDSLKMFDHPHLGDAIYVITDGGDNASSASLKRVAQTLEDAGVRLFAFVFVKDSGGVSREEVLGPEDVMQIVEETGGTIVGFHNEYRGVFLIPPDPDIVDKSGKPTLLGLLLGSQYRQISNFHRVTIDSPAKVDRREKLKLNLVGLNKSQQENFVLKYPYKLAPCQ
jgi:hypothetical protein